MRLAVSVFFMFLVFQSKVGNAAQIADCEFHGAGATKTSTLIELLPGALPLDLSADDLAEFIRRVKNLGIFDSVEAKIEGQRLVVHLKRKYTLSPSVALATGKTFEDSAFSLGLQEYDFRGDGTRVGAKASYAEREYNFAVWMDEHTYSPQRWAKEFEAYRMSSNFRFSGSDVKWSRHRLGGFAEWVSPFYYGSHLIYEFQLVSYYETFTNTVRSPDLASGVYVGGLFEVIYDRYKWDDLTPDGYKLVLENRPGTIVSGRFRGEVRFKLLSALRLSSTDSFVLNGQVAVVNSGDVNHSLLIGSQQGVRGLADSLYRASDFAFINSELRHSLRVADRVYVQPVAFADAAVFRPMSLGGNRLNSEEAFSMGLGARVVPTALTNLLLRADVARLFQPYEDWTTLIGLAQYF